MVGRMIKCSVMQRYIYLYPAVLHLRSVKAISAIYPRGTAECINCFNAKFIEDLEIKISIIL